MYAAAADARMAALKMPADTGEASAAAQDPASPLNNTRHKKRTSISCGFSLYSGMSLPPERFGHFHYQTALKLSGKTPPILFGNGRCPGAGLVRTSRLTVSAPPSL